MNLDGAPAPHGAYTNRPRGRVFTRWCGAILIAEATSSYGVMDILLFGERYGESWIDEAQAGEQELPSACARGACQL